METKSKFMKTISWILNILIVGLLILGIYLFAARIFGDSPTDFQFISWIAGFFGAAMIKMFSLTYNLNREVGELKIGVKSGFKRIKIDIDDVKQSLNELRSDVQDIRPKRRMKK